MARGLLVRRRKGVFFMILASSLLLSVHSEQENEVTAAGQRGGILTSDDADILEQFAKYVVEQRIDPGQVYTPGIAAIMGIQRNNGLTVVVRVSVWIGATCNLGMGSEQLHYIPAGVVPGLAIQEAFSDHLFAPVVQLMRQGLAYGYAVYRGVCVDYYPLAFGRNSQPDDDTDHRKDELFEFVKTVKTRDPSKAGISSTEGDYWLDVSSLPQHTHYPKQGNDSSSRGAAALQLRGKHNIPSASASMELEKIISSTTKSKDSTNISLDDSYGSHENWPMDVNGNCLLIKTGLLSTSVTDNNDW